MKINFADTTKEPTLKSLSIIMKEVAEEAKMKDAKAKELLSNSVKNELKRLLAKYT